MVNKRHRAWRAKQSPETIARLDKMDADMKVQATAFYCSWGRHRTWPLSELSGQFEHGTMCLDCQMKIAENLRSSVFLPEMTAVIHAAERFRFNEGKRENARLTELARKAPGVDVNGMVYYIRINGQIKIGYTANLRQRSRNYPPGSELLAFEPGTRFTERERHQDFRRYLVKGREWFTESEPLAAHIASLVEAYGVPDQLMHRYTSPK